MPSRRLARTDLRDLVVLRRAGRAVHDDFPRMRAALAARAGAEAARLFAEPVLTQGNGATVGNIEWSTELDGAAVSLSSLPPEQQKPVTERLVRLLGRLAPLRDDPELGAWLRRALVLHDLTDVWAVGDAPLLTGWGLLPPGESEDEAGLARAARVVLGTWLPADSQTVAPPAAPPSTAASLPTQAPQLPPPPNMAEGTANWPLGRWLLPAGIATAAVFLALGLWIGARAVRLLAEATPRVAQIVENPDSVRRALDLQREQNAGLEARIAEVRQSLQGNMCVADPATMPRLGPDRAATVPPAALPPPPPGAQRFEGQLAQLLDQAVVLVLVRGPEGSATGSGFFITPELVVTNRHVVEGGGTVTLASRALGRVLPAQVVATTENSDVGNPDFALLRVTEAQRIQPLALTPHVGRLDEVIAAGFPALVAEGDVAYRGLLQGDASGLSRLEPVLSDGRIQAVQSLPSGLQAMPHSAQISPGSSGGPLVDACGRVVGVNTFGRSSREMPVTVSYAQKAESLQAFLRANNAQATELAGACAAAPAPAATPPAATPAAPGTAPAPAPAGAGTPTPAPVAPPAGAPVPPTPQR